MSQSEHKHLWMSFRLWQSVPMEERTCEHCGTKEQRRGEGEWKPFIDQAANLREA
jgi:hypothetical protein